MKIRAYSALMAITGLVFTSAAKLPGSLFGEWKEDCVKSVESLGQGGTAPFVQATFILGWNQTIETQTAYYKDERCTERVSKKREWSKYRVLSAKGTSAKIAIRKDLGGGMIHEDIVEVKLSSKKLSYRTLMTQMDLEELLNENPLKELSKTSGANEKVRWMTRGSSESAPKSKL